MKTLILLLVAVVHLTSILCTRMTNKIYGTLDAESFCFRRLNATHQIGCTSKPSGNVGVIHVINTIESFNWVEKDGPDPPYIAVLAAEYFTTGNMTKLLNSQRLTGVLVIPPTDNTTDYPQSNYSPVNSCPNENYGLYVDDIPEYSHCRKNQGWVPDNQALGMLYKDWNMPIVLLTNETQIEMLLNQCYKTFNEPINGTAKPWPLCAVEISSFMLAARDSPTCMRRSNKLSNIMNPVNLCDPLGGRNVITMLFPTNHTQGLRNRSLITVAARLDAASLFDSLAPGADSAVTGLVALLSIAHTLAKVKDEIQQNLSPDRPNNVLFAIFNGESFDYIGSSRAVFDMERGKFPNELKPDVDQLALIRLNHISNFFELSQLQPVNNTNTFWLHSDPVSQDSNDSVKNAVNEMVETLKKESAPDILFKNLTDPLPPASIQRFLKRDLNIPGVVVTNFKDKFTNGFYNSRFDTESHLSNNTAEFITKISTGMAKTIYKYLTGNEITNLKADLNIIEEMLECYLRNASCLLFRQVEIPGKPVDPSLLRTLPYSLYISVPNNGQINFATGYTRALLAYLTGDQLEGFDKDNCTANITDNLYEFDWMRSTEEANSTGVCVKSLSKFTIAVSPAAVLNDWTSKEYSTWTESVWQTVTLRIFLRPSRALEGLTFGLGVAIFILSTTLVYFINKRASILFGSRTLTAC